MMIHASSPAAPIATASIRRRARFSFAAVPLLLMIAPSLAAGPWQTTIKETGWSEWDATADGAPPGDWGRPQEIAAAEGFETVVAQARPVAPTAVKKSPERERPARKAAPAKALRANAARAAKVAPPMPAEHERSAPLPLPAPAATAEGAPSTPAVEPASPASDRPQSSPESVKLAATYCEAVRDEAAEVRNELARKSILEMQRFVNERIDVLEHTAREARLWLEKREAFSAKAQAALVDIYSGMDAEAAAKQLIAMDEVIAAALFSKLSAERASKILGEMDATKAARLTAILASFSGLAASQGAAAMAAKQ